MSQKIINLTLLQVAKEVKNILMDYPEYPYQTVFSVVEIRQELINSVLRNLPNRYLMISDEQKFIEDYNFCYYPLEKRLHIENLIQVNIHSMIQLLGLNSHNLLCK